jgi:putative aminopeptidase FrvX
MNEKFLEKYVNSYSPSGSEMLAQQLWVEEMKKYADDITVEPYGNAVATKYCPGTEKRSLSNGFTAEVVDHPVYRKKVIIEAHVDEVAYRVNIIGDNGLIYVIKNGNADHVIAPGSRVKIHTEKGMVDGVFGWPAIHTRSTTESKETHPNIENIFIDCGVDSKKELVKMGVKIGDLVTYPSNFEILGKYYTGKGLDNKIGGYILTQVMKKFNDAKTQSQYELLFANVVQEEVGLRGASMILRNNRPDLAIVIDVTHDTSTPMMNKKKSGDVTCGKGPVLTLSTVTHPKFVGLLEKTAIDNKIKYQRKALGRTSGTDADNYANNGVVTALVSIPMRYMHTKVEMVHTRDVENSIDLIYNTLKNLELEYDFGFFKK